MKQSREAVLFSLSLFWTSSPEPAFIWADGLSCGGGSVVLLLLWSWFTEGGSGSRKQQMEPVGARVCGPWQVQVWDGFWPLPVTCSFYCLRMSKSHPIGGFPDFLWPEARIGNTRSDVEGDLGEGQLRRGPEIRDPHSFPFLGLYWAWGVASERLHLGCVLISHVSCSSFVFVILSKASCVCIFRWQWWYFCFVFLK